MFNLTIVYNSYDLLFPTEGWRTKSCVLNGNLYNIPAENILSTGRRLDYNVYAMAEIKISKSAFNGSTINLLCGDADEVVIPVDPTSDEGTSISFHGNAG